MAKRTCSVDGCERVLYAKGICEAHYARQRAWGELRPDIPVGHAGGRRKPLEDRFWDHVDASGDCWEWTHTLSPVGYGVVSRPRSGGRHVRTGAHRYAWEQLVGPIPAGLELDHRCRNTRCVNPAHLEPVTGEVNRSRIPRPPVCHKGHPFSGDNLVMVGNARKCRTCLREGYRRFYAAHREERIAEMRKRYQDRKAAA